MLDRLEMPDRFQSIENKLAEVAAKQNALVDMILQLGGLVLQLGTKVDAQTSEMKSNYAGYEGWAKELAARTKV
jgi:hypothetical protein